MTTALEKPSQGVSAKTHIRKELGRSALVLVVIWVLTVTSNVVFPVQGDVQNRSDAVVSLAPQVERLATAEKLVASNHSETLVISYFDGDVRGAAPGEPDAQVPVANYCELNEQSGIICFTPEEVAAIGEAFTVRDIAQNASWDAVTVVTSRTHAFRARYIFERCLGEGIDVDLVYADPDLNAAQWGWHIAYENAAFLKALWQTSTRC